MCPSESIGLRNGLFAFMRGFIFERIGECKDDIVSSGYSKVNYK